jgi:hypothetical protein
MPFLCSLIVVSHGSTVGIRGLLCPCPPWRSTVSQGRKAFSGMSEIARVRDVFRNASSSSIMQVSTTKRKKGGIVWSLAGGRGWTRRKPRRASPRVSCACRLGSRAPPSSDGRPHRSQAGASFCLDCAVKVHQLQGNPNRFHR